jgi:hypothetical protein
VGLELGPHSLVRITEELFEWKRSGSGLENRDYGRGIRCADHALSAKVGTNFADRWRSLGRYSLLTDWSHGVLYLSVPSGLFPSGFPTKFVYTFLFYPCVLHFLSSSSS